MKHSITLILLTQSFSLLPTTQFCGQPSTYLQELQEPELAMNAPPSFGKTHFIVNHPTHDATQETGATSEILPSPAGAQAFFTPDDNILNELIRYIGQETEKIQVAIFIMTHPKITQAIVQALNRNVSIELITDAGCLKERYNTINELCRQGCSVRIYNPSYKKRGRASLMHHKFVLFTNNLGKSLVWTGSYNFTKQASDANQENALVVDDQKIFDIFSRQFQRLRKRSYRYGQVKKGARS